MAAPMLLKTSVPLSNPASSTSLQIGLTSSAISSIQESFLLPSVGDDETVVSGGDAVQEIVVELRVRRESV